MSQKTYKVQAVATMLDTTVESVRRYVDESGIAVVRQENGPRTRQFSLENIFDLAAWRQIHRPKLKLKKKLIATIYAPKGGVGKTTIAANLASIYALMGLRTLIIDLDFQANLTLAFGYDSELTVEEASETGLPQEKVVEAHFGNLIPGWPYGRSSLRSVVKMPYGENGPHLIPADLTLDRLDTILTYDAIEGRKSDLKIAAMIQEGLSGSNSDFDLSKYDVILFDAAPAKNRMTRGALLASDYVVSPVSMEKFSTKAISYLSSVLTDMREDIGRSPELVVIGNFHTPNRLRVINQMSVLSHEYPGALLDNVIRRSEEFPKTLSEDDDLPPLAMAKPTSESAIELRAVAKALLEKTGVING